LRAEEPDLLRAEVLACRVRLVVLLRGRDAPLGARVAMMLTVASISGLTKDPAGVSPTARAAQRIVSRPSQRHPADGQAPARARRTGGQAPARARRADGLTPARTGLTPARARRTGKEKHVITCFSLPDHR
jgi:hypothetical protein